MTYNWQLPYPSKRFPVFARNMVASSQPLAVQAGIEALREGGNAVDAALATAITLTVVEPCNNGIGSDAFALVWDGNRLHGLNASGRSPKAWSPERFSSHTTMPGLGWDAVTVPGAVSAWVALSDEFGRLPFDKLFNAAIHYAEQGYQVGPETAYFWKLAENIYKEFDEFRHVFLPGGKAPGPGERVSLPLHANTLKKIAASKGKDFYQGSLAQSIANDAARLGGALTAEDMAEHQAQWVKPLSQKYQSQQQGEIELHEIPPNGQGLMALIAAGVLNHLYPGKYPVDSADSLHLQIEAMRSAYAEIKSHLADRDFMHVSPEKLLDKNWL
ncbi:MAG: gamma-glutamyltransferase, partial [Gammaproteobacteria bacterium]|nr:gamma-glutamyltransferase [Gammaproteobacteria bacterium]